MLSSESRIFKKIGNLVCLGFASSIVLSQWVYASQQAGWYSTPLKLMTSIFFWSIAVVLFGCFNYIQDPSIGFRSGRSRRVMIAMWLLFWGTLPSVLVTLVREGSGSSNFLEGLKILFAILAGIFVPIILKNQVKYGIFLIVIVILISIVFGVVQIMLRVNFATGEGFFTAGASHRWWDLNAVWGTMAFSGKNTYGLVLVLCIAVLFPILLRETVVQYSKKLLIPLLALSILCIYESRSRTAIVILVLVLTLEFKRRVRRSKYGVGPLLLFFGGSIFAWFILKNGMGMHDHWLLDMQSLGFRRQEIQAAVTSQDNNWIFGSGFNSIFRITGSTFGDSLQSGNLQLGVNTDNSFLRRWLEAGIIGIITLFLFIGLLFFSRRMQVEGSQIESWPWLDSISYVALAVFVSSLFGDFMNFQVNIAICSLVLGCAMVGLENSEIEVRDK